MQSSSNIKLPITDILPTDLPPKTLNLLEKITGHACGSVSEVKKLCGDASDRKYFRVIFHKGNEKQTSLIIMLLANCEKGELPFINVHRFLTENSIPVPEIYLYEQEHGILFLEDCGDLTFETVIRKNSNIQKNEALYKKAIDIMIDMQFSVRQPNNRCLAFSLCFDEKKLMWELNFMVNHLIKGYFNKIVSPADRETIEQGFLMICKELALQERVFTHRDYHSRNIMIRNDRLFILDFQDARLGPAQYDLASLLRDSYVVLTEESVTNLMNYYFTKREEKGGKVDQMQFVRIFHLMSIQRNLKALGTFAFQKVIKGNSNYIQYINPTLAYVRKNLGRYQNLGQLKHALEKYFPDPASL